MSAVILVWNNKDLSDLKILSRPDGCVMIFENSVDAMDHAKKTFVNFEIVTLYNAEE